MPSAVVATDDIMAYFSGMALGRTFMGKRDREDRVNVFTYESQ